MENDYSMYRYYDGTDNYSNKKAEFFGFYEKSFEITYTGYAEDKAEKFKDYLMAILYEQISDACHFGAEGVDKDKCFEDYIRVYYEPKYKLENYK